MSNINFKKNIIRKFQIAFVLDGNFPISEIKIFRKNTLPLIKVEYAQNGVTSDLLPLNVIKTGENEFSAKSNMPFFATHIYMSCICDEDITDINVEIFEEEASHLDAYPKCIDKELDKNYYLENISVISKGKGYFDFSLYTSIDGENFSFISRHQGLGLGKTFTVKAEKTEARFIRVFLEYCSEYDNCKIDEISFTGIESNTPIITAHEIQIPDFIDSEYNIEVTDGDTYKEIYGIIERTVGKEYQNWFSFELSDNPIENHNFDYFELSDRCGKILIKGNNGVSLATGFNHYLKYYCKVNISQVGNQTKMPENIVAINGTVFKETKAKIRYAYNYCTLSYTMAFWGEDEWRKELDWLALNGVNLVLDITAQEEVWRRFLKKIGYSLKEIKNFLTGPAYFAWLYMANTTTIGGPLHDGWFSDRVELARKNHLIMRKLGMYPILQGYSGMMPLDIKKYDNNIDIIEQGTWCASTRPPMLRTTSKSYKDYAESFYKCQREVYGDYSFYYATDPFHEGGRTADMKPREISYRVLSEMLKENPNAVWVIQSWQGNPSSELLLGLTDVENGKEHALILDLYAEKDPNYLKGNKENSEHGYSIEFDNTPWIYCMLNNFGGRLGLHGHLDNMVKNIPTAFNTTKCIKGIGITPEASENNPLLYDFFFESIWQDNADEPLPQVDINCWLREYAVRRYGKESENAISALNILKETVYKAELNMIGQGAPECILNARPAFEISAASTWGNAIIGYNPEELKKALEFMKKDFELLKDSEGYIYDLVTLKLQVLANEMLPCHKMLKECFESRDIDGFKTQCGKILEIADEMEAEAEKSKYYRLDRMVARAEKLARNADDFTKRLYKINAKAQVTTWGEYKRSELGLLHDYSNRPWAGLIKDFYKPRWERWMKLQINKLDDRPFEQNIDWFRWEWNWVRK